MPGWKTIWTMTITYSRYDTRTYSWIENEQGESAFIWYYVGSGW